MARSRSRRRRQNLVVLLAVVVTVSVLLVARDVSVQSSHSRANRASLNRTFAVLARSILVDERRYGHQVSVLLTGGSGVSRSTLAARITQVELEGAQLRQRAGLLATPRLDGNVQATLIRVTDLRVGAVEHLLDRVAAALSLPHRGRSGPVAAAQGDLRRSNHLWAAARRRLATAPGAARLMRSVFPLGRADLSSELVALAAAPSLQAVRAVRLVAIEVVPAPFPAPAGQLVLGPGHVISIDVVVENAQYIDQPYHLRLQISPSTHAGRSLSRTASGTLGPLASRAVDFGGLRVSPGEAATVNISLIATPVAAGHHGQRTYHLTVAPSPST